MSQSTHTINSFYEGGRGKSPRPLSNTYTRPGCPALSCCLVVIESLCSGYLCSIKLFELSYGLCNLNNAHFPLDLPLVVCSPVRPNNVKLPLLLVLGFSSFTPPPGSYNTLHNRGCPHPNRHRPPILCHRKYCIQPILAQDKVARDSSVPSLPLFWR